MSKRKLVMIDLTQDEEEQERPKKYQALGECALCFEDITKVRIQFMCCRTEESTKECCFKCLGGLRKTGATACPFCRKLCTISSNTVIVTMECLYPRITLKINVPLITHIYQLPKFILSKPEWVSFSLNHASSCLFPKTCFLSNLSIENMSFIYKGFILDPQSTLFSYDITEGATISIIYCD